MVSKALIFRVIKHYGYSTIIPEQLCFSNTALCNSSVKACGLHGNDNRFALNGDGYKATGCIYPGYAYAYFTGIIRRDVAIAIVIAVLLVVISVRRIVVAITLICVVVAIGIVIVAVACLSVTVLGTVVLITVLIIVGLVASGRVLIFVTGIFARCAVVGLVIFVTRTVTIGSVGIFVTNSGAGAIAGL